MPQKMRRNATRNISAPTGKTAAMKIPSPSASAQRYVTSVLAAISSAYRCKMSKDMVSLQGAFFIAGAGQEQLAEVKYNTPPHIREDMVRVMGRADIRFRGQFDNWYMDLEISYNKVSAYSLNDIISLIDLGGYNCGIGEWRPEKSGQNGMFHVE